MSNSTSSYELRVYWTDENHGCEDSADECKGDLAACLRVLAKRVESAHWGRLDTAITRYTIFELEGETATTIMTHAVK